MRTMQGVKRTLVLPALLFCTLLLFNACTSNPTQSTDSATLKIGLALPVTGAYSVAGEAISDGIQIATDEINSAGGVNGKQIETILEDTHSSFSDAVTAVKKLIDVDNVPVIIGGALSGEAIPMAPVVQEAHVVLLSPTALTTPLETAGEWVFKLRESSGVHAKKTLELMQKAGHSKIGIISQQYETCDDLLNWMSKFYSEYNIQLVLTEKYGPKDTDMRTQLSKIKETDIDAWYACGLYQDVGLVFKQARELDLKKPAYTMVAVESKKLFEIAGNAAEGVQFPSTALSCEHAKSFCETYRKKFNKEPDYRIAFGYDSMKLITEAIKRKGYSSEGIQQGLLSIQNWQGASGSTSFDEQGNAQKEVIVKQVRNGTFVVVD